jgi:hypothetical protein
MTEALEGLPIATDLPGVQRDRSYDPAMRPFRKGGRPSEECHCWWS